MGMLSDFLQNRLVDGLRRGGAINGSGALNSANVVKGLWAATTAYVVGDIVVPVANTSAGGKYLRCTVAGTSGGTFTTALGNPGSTLADNTVTWEVLSGIPALNTVYIALLKCTKGQRANTTAYLLNDTIAVLIGGKNYLYKCTTAGTTAGSQPGTYVGAANEAITDGTAVFTEQTAALDANSSMNEAAGGGYARVAVANSLANWAGTQAAASTTASSGTGGVTSNNAAITFPAISADWTTGTEKIWAWAEYDAATTGNLLNWGGLTTVQSILNGQAAPSFSAAQLTQTVGN